MTKDKYDQPWDYFPLPELHAFTSLKKARKFVKKITGLRFEPSGKQGTFTAYENNGMKFCVIYLDFSQKISKWRYALLAHECTHYARYVEEHFGNQLDEETEAYTVQCAMLACINQIGEEWFESGELEDKCK